LTTRHRYEKDPSSFSEGVAYGREAIDISKAQNTFCPTISIIFAEVIRLYADEHGHNEHWTWVKNICHDVISNLPPGSYLRARASRILGYSLIRCWEPSAANGKQYIEEALHLSLQMLADIGTTHDSMLHECLSNHAALLHLQYQQLGDVQALNKARQYHGRALNICPSTHVARPVELSRLCMCQALRFMSFGNLHDLDEALTIGRDALNNSFPDGIFQTYMVSHVAGILRLRFDKLSMDSDLDEAIELSRKALRIPTSIADRARWFNNRADCLVARFISHGAQDDLDEAIRIQREVLESTPKDYIYFRERMVCLVDPLILRYKDLGNVDDLNEAVKLLRTATGVRISFTDLNFFRLLADALSIRFEALGIAEDIEEAITTSQHLLKLAPEKNHYHLPAVFQLARAHLLRGKRYGILQDIDKSIQLLESVPRQDVVSSALAADCLLNLSSSYLARYNHTRERHDATGAKDVLLELLDVVSESRRDLFQCLLRIAQLHLQEGTPYRDTSSCLQYLAKSVTINQYDARSRLRYIVPVLRDLESFEEGIPPPDSPARVQLVDIYAAVVALLPHVAFFALDLSARFQYLAAGQSIATVGASHAIATGQPERALEILEQGRAVFWTHALRLRSQFDLVPDDIRQQLLGLSRQLERNSAVSTVSSDPSAMEKAAVRRRQQTEAFVSLVGRVRELPGLERFMLHDEMATLSRAADKGPVVVLVPSNAACHAIILRAEHKPISIALPLLTEIWVVRSSKCWRAAASETRAETTHRLKLMASNRQAILSSAGAVLEGLWTKLVWPVLSTLGLKVSYPQTDVR
jgi:tetratricopeptide (TPR) repeat protein